LINAPSAVDATSTLSLDVQLLQARLFQLSILHRDSESTEKSWEDDARRKLHRKFDDVAKKCESVQETERGVRQNVNVNALKEWGAGDAGLLAENVQLLASVVEEVMVLVEEDGRVYGVLSIFEEWMTYVNNIWQIRQSAPSRGETEFIEGLGEKWRAECRALMRRLGALGRVLDGLERAQEGSSLYSVMENVRKLRSGAVEELKTVLSIEEDIVKREKVWVDEMIGGLDRHIGRAGLVT
jgi:hypothetical protein